ncbi:amidase domain-containing protein [Paenibacillus sediminis]|uniref:Putative amidase domain-containing protein n=1 Tax=Paenibacillus sediminis TaxID=664909 RepID=A0ABS4H664_9BACL|nr:amidase domain-containing protein [Paenibacillus sediminis]MBP1938011.1 hypothetical protein [Paenibacillus sediminis]
MERDWKNTLFLYVNQYNQSEIDFQKQTEMNIVTDLNYLMQKSERTRRLNVWYKERGAVPLRSETRARVLRSLEQRDGEVIADLQLHSHIFYEKGGMTHHEEQIRKERLTLIRDGNTWIVAKVEHIVPEKNPIYDQAPKESNSAYLSQKAESLPFLNQDILRYHTNRNPKQYRREEAVSYANRWWNSSNPEFIAFEVDCTSYISQCLFAGGAPINYTGRRDSGWWYKGYIGKQEAWSYSWAVSNSLLHYLTSSKWGLRADEAERAEQLSPGDVIIYDWDGNGVYQHSTVVTALDAGGMPLVNAHTVSSRSRYWDYRDSYAWTESTKYRFLRIVDQF